MEIEQRNKSKASLKVLSWNNVMIWKWKTDEEECAICKLFLSALCPECGEDGDNKDNCSCKPIWGKCKHVYHQHCIAEWIEKRKTCPLCQTKWEENKFN